MLGSLPAILAISGAGAIFGSVNPGSFLSALNLANFLEQASAVIVIAMAVSFTLLLGEIDLAAGFTAGVSAAVLATRLDEWPLLPSVLVAALVAVALGSFTGFMVAKVGIPSFVVTLANVLLFQGHSAVAGARRRQRADRQPASKGSRRRNADPDPVLDLGDRTGLVLLAAALIRRQQVSHGAIPMSIVAFKLGAARAGSLIVLQILNPQSGLPECAGTDSRHALGHPGRHRSAPGLELHPGENSLRPPSDGGRGQR